MDIQHHIDLIPSASLLNLRQDRTFPKEREILQGQVEEFIQKDLITKSVISYNNIGIYGSSVMNAASIVQQNSQQDQNPHQIQQRQQQQQQGASSVTSHFTSQTGQVSLQICLGPDGLLLMQKKPQLDIVEEHFVAAMAANA